MTVATTAGQSAAEGAQVSEHPVGGVRFDWVVAGLSAWLLAGLYLDGWAHSHGKVDNTFFTPWHAVLYSGILTLFVFLVFNQSRNMAKGHAWR